MKAEEVQKLRDQNLTFQQIGDMFGVSRQRVHQVYRGSWEYQKKIFPNVLMYNRHKWHKKKEGVKPYKKCDYCKRDDPNML